MDYCMVKNKIFRIKSSDLPPVGREQENPDH